MSEASWFCRNPECGLLFVWNRQIQMATYNKGEEPINKLVPGGTKPNGCPECGSEAVEQLEG
jgi:hypothetical protein